MINMRLNEIRPLILCIWWSWVTWSVINHFGKGLVQCRNLDVASQKLNICRNTGEFRFWHLLAFEQCVMIFTSFFRAVQNAMMTQSKCLYFLCRLKCSVNLNPYEQRNFIELSFIQAVDSPQGDHSNAWLNYHDPPVRTMLTPFSSFFFYFSFAI